MARGAGRAAAGRLVARTWRRRGPGPPSGPREGKERPPAAGGRMGPSQPPPGRTRSRAAAGRLPPQGPVQAVTGTGRPVDPPSPPPPLQWPPAGMLRWANGPRLAPWHTPRRRSAVGARPAPPRHTTRRRPLPYPPPDAAAAFSHAALPRRRPVPYVFRAAGRPITTRRRLRGASPSHRAGPAAGERGPGSQTPEASGRRGLALPAWASAMPAEEARTARTPIRRPGPVTGPGRPASRNSRWYSRRRRRQRRWRRRKLEGPARATGL